MQCEKPTSSFSLHMWIFSIPSTCVEETFSPACFMLLAFGVLTVTVAVGFISGYYLSPALLVFGSNLSQNHAGFVTMELQVQFEGRYYVLSSIAFYS